ncbi:TRAP transporter large permease [Afifella sp. IM 167]|uniref:TRAP transporter large permease n=1 Tax=Afifella sp. IM 167 TaxID=2033586 RepID=UPI001CD030BA|nr:TRAP transporter large permease [Afifella sp. IM 167]MBZ8131854.1 C4-dicarboxylate ABC transporter permease [Afifella sp. IM 167]
MSLLFLWLFLIGVALGLPIFFVLLLAPALSLWMDGSLSLYIQIVSRLFNGIYSFPLMAIPLFMLAGELMNSGQITARIVAFSQALIGRIRGSLAHVNILSSILFAGLSGSAVADASAIGSMMIPAMEKAGYSRRFAAAITAASAVIGPIIPPSIIMIIYAFIMQISPGALFAAGVVPGLLIGVALMAATALMGKRLNLPRDEAPLPRQERILAIRQAILPLMTPVILLGGILSGIFTPTEAAGVAVVYTFVISFFVLKTVKLADIPGILRRTALLSGTILLVIGASVAFAWMATITGLPRRLAEITLGFSDNRVVLLILLNVLLFLVGMVLDAGPALLILGPVLAPIFVGQLGLDPLHFAIIMCVNATVGLVTPPFGLVLFVTSAVSREPISGVLSAMLPFLLVEIGVILLLTFVPELCLTLPHWLGFR